MYRLWRLRKALSVPGECDGKYETGCPYIPEGLIEKGGGNVPGAKNNCCESIKSFRQESTLAALTVQRQNAVFAFRVHLPLHS